jgi:hypothetical protein
MGQMRRTFQHSEHPGKSRYVQFPNGMLWNERTVWIWESGDQSPTVENFQNAGAARRYAASIVTSWTAAGWREAVAVPVGPLTVERVLTEDEITDYAATIAAELGDNPNWMLVWQRLLGITASAPSRRAILLRIQELHSRRAVVVSQSTKPAPQVAPVGPVPVHVPIRKINVREE